MTGSEFKLGAVAWTRFPFSVEPAAKDRPVVLLGKSPIGNAWLVAKITSTTDKRMGFNLDLLIEKGTIESSLAQLTETSLVQIFNIAVIDAKHLRPKGFISNDQLCKLLNSLNVYLTKPCGK